MNDTHTAITVVDAIMGSGKTNWAIQYVNDATTKNRGEVFDGLPGNRRFLYVAPFLAEVDRITNACPDTHFRNPQPIHGRKLYDLKRLIDDGESVCTTHALFRMLNKDIYDALKRQNYTLVIDEVISCVDLFDTLSRADQKMLFDGGYVVVRENSRLAWNHDRFPHYRGKFDDVRNLCDNGNLVAYGKNTETGYPKVLIWEFPSEFLRCFRQVFILTYMFHGSPMLSYFESEGLRFNMKSMTDGALADWGSDNEAALKAKLRSLVTIYDGAMNSIGASNGRGQPLSSTWFDRQPPRVLKNLKSSTEWFFKSIAKTPSALNAWTTFSKVKPTLKGHGYARGFIPVNAKATNDYIDRRSVAYLANIFHKPDIKGFFADRGVPVYEDLHALSEMIQWVWRSGIRRDDPIAVFMPSERMRGLLKEWLASDNTPDLIAKRSAAATADDNIPAAEAA